ncbi:hypothetical protein [Rhodopila sp.]|jgi:hypothetical protein|uniref:hypothetical protein n=1 Tax=Rhodopila sp. TaxID=2480087 RepID=UPI002B7032BB|nr:hypothetical protein [Rhodopila sp.]HVZ08519.1 hypothetical protein [Rhodopila sp.]
MSSGSSTSSVRQYHPATFLERGVAIPFTTPLLYGTRARPGQRNGAELIIPNPSGGRGVYIMSWASMAQLCTPTLHDRIFNEQIALLPSVTPASIRRVARKIALEGLAGDQAMEAADAAIAAEATDRTVTNYELLMRLVDQVAASPNAPFSARGHDTRDAARRARLTADFVSRLLGRSPDWLATALEQLADIITPFGTGTNDARARLPRVAARLRGVRKELANWSEAQVEEGLIEHCRVILALADVTLALADDVLKQAQELTGDVIELLRQWDANQDSIAERAARPDWLLDGWEQISLIWSHARDDAARRAAVAEIVALTPVMPKEVDGWLGGAEAANDILRFRRLVPLNEDWRTGAVAFKLVARNETFRALAA